MQPDDKSNHVESTPRQLQSVDDPQAPKAQRHRQEDNLPPLVSNHNRILCRQRTSKIFWQHRKVIYIEPSREYCIYDTSQDGQVRIGDSWMESYDNSPEEMG